MRRSARSIVSALSLVPNLLGVMALAAGADARRGQNATDGRLEARVVRLRVDTKRAFPRVSRNEALGAIEDPAGDASEWKLRRATRADAGDHLRRHAVEVQRKKRRASTRLSLWPVRHEGQRLDLGARLRAGRLRSYLAQSEWRSLCRGRRRRTTALVLRSTDLGKTWRNITGTASGEFIGISPDPDHPGLIQIHAWGLREYTIVADDENYQWRSVHGRPPVAGRRPSNDFFSRNSSSTNRFHFYPATLSNYFRYDFGDQVSVQALEVVPEKTRFEFARGARVVVPVRVVYHFDPDTALTDPQHRAAEGRRIPKPTPPAEKFADQPDGTDFWGLRVESAGDQIEKYPAGRRVVTTSFETTADGKTVSSTHQPAAVKYRVVELSPSSPYARELDLGRFSDFSKLGEYRVQIIYDSGGHPEQDESVWDGDFTSPVFTVVIRE